MKYTRAFAAFVAFTLCTTSFNLKPATAQSETAACKDIPSCVVESFVIIGGVGYWIIKNTATGLTRRVPAHTKIHAGEEAEGWKLNGLVDTEEQCVRKALTKSEATGKRWTSKIKPAGVSSPSGTPQYFCYLKELEEQY